MAEQPSSEKKPDEDEAKPPTQVVRVKPVSETEDARMNHDG